jgi:hypothetical protein
MAVLGRLLFSSAERLDLADLLSIDSYVAGDFKYLLKGIVGNDRPYILKGFDVIDPVNAIGTQGCSIRVADSIVFYPGSNAGPFFHGLEEGNANALPLVPELRKDAVNYVYLTFSTFNTATDTRAFWDPDKDGGAGGEFTQDVNTESVLKCEVNVSVGSFPENTIPIAKITVGPVAITHIEDARDMMFRLGTGGISPDPYSTYNFKSLPSSGYKRTEPPTKMQAGGVNPFQGADKNIYSLKEWMDVVMTKLKELGGTTYWYEDTGAYSLISVFTDALATTFKSKGFWTHDTSTAGLLTWSEDLQIKVTSDQRTYIIRNGNKTLNDEQVAYLPFVRGEAINGTDQAVSWINGQPTVNTVGGSVGLFTNLAKGDWIKKINDGNHLFLRVEEFYDSVNLGGSTTTAANAKSIRLSGNYQGVTGEERARYDKGVYQAADITVSDRDQAAITALGGDFHWLALRSDTIQNTSNIVSTALTGIAISDHDGTTAKVTAGAPHGLVDSDYITISGTTNFNGTYKVEVESTTVFYISKSGGPFADESGNAYYAVVTTSARSTAYSLQLESANHGFSNDDTIIIAGTTNFNGSKKINVRSATTFNIPMSSAPATETSGTATRANIIVRTEYAVGRLIQGESIAVDGGLTNNIKLFLGMGSDSQTYPAYHTSPTYNALDGQHSFNADPTDNVTERLSKLSAMMADKAQDKVIKYLNNGATSVTNTTNGAAQELTFLPSGSTLVLMQPGSPGNATVTLPHVAPGISLQVNEVAYVTIDRNAASTPAITVVNKEDLLADENKFVIAERLSSGDCWLWDGTLVPEGVTPMPILGAAQDRNTKLVKGGVWSWNSSTNTLAWTLDAYIQIPGVAESRNTVLAASNTALDADGKCLYVDLNRTPGAAANLTVNVATIASVPNTQGILIIARRLGNNVFVGNGTMLLVHGESKELEAGLSVQNRLVLGGASLLESSQYPTYDTRGAVNRITNNTESALDAIARHDVEFDKAFGQLRMIAKTAGNKKRVRITGAERVMFSGETIAQEISSLRMSFTGAEIDFATGVIYGGDATLPLSTDFVTALGTNFTPATITASQYLWYSVAANPSTTNGDGTINIQFNVTAGSASGATPTAAIKPALAGVKKIGYVVVKDNGTGGSGTVLDFDDAGFTLPGTTAQAKIAQLGVGSGSGGGAGVNKAKLLDVASTTLPTGAVTVDGVVVDPGDNVLFTGLSSGNNKVYKAAGTIGNITGWNAQFIFDGSSNPSDGDMVYIQQGNMYSDQLLGFDSTIWFNVLNHKIEATLLDNQSTPTVLLQVAHADFKHIAMEYSIQRGSAYKTVQFVAATDGTSADLTELPVEIGTCGVTLSVDVSGSVFRILYTTTNTGANATMKRTVRVW